MVHRALRWPVAVEVNSSADRMGLLAEEEEEETTLCARWQLVWGGCTDLPVLLLRVRLLLLVR